jgi:hypothetical protein
LKERDGVQGGREREERKGRERKKIKFSVFRKIFET